MCVGLFPGVCVSVCVCLSVYICQGLHASVRKLQVLVCLHSRLSLQPQSGVFSEGHILLQGFFLKPFEFCQNLKFKKHLFSTSALSKYYQRAGPLCMLNGNGLEIRFKRSHLPLQCSLSKCCFHPIYKSLTPHPVSLSCFSSSASFLFFSPSQ